MEDSHLQTLVGRDPLLFLACWLLLALAITIAPALPSAVAIGWLVGGWLGRGGINNDGWWCGNKPSPRGLDKETLGERWYVFGDGVIFDVLLHFCEEFGCKLHRNCYLFALEFVVAGLNLVGVDRVLRERSEVHEKLMDFGHENHG